MGCRRGLPASTSGSRMSLRQPSRRHALWVLAAVTASILNVCEAPRSFCD